jgi:release factor glutamine methyltransferase
MTVKALQEEFQKQLIFNHPKDEINSFFYLLSEAYLDKNRLDIALAPNDEINNSKTTLFLDALAQLKNEYPIQYIIGEVEFMDLTFEVNKNVLIPRPETEELIKWVLTTEKGSEELSILDIGTGSGCIPIILAHSLAKSSVTSFDVSEKAIEVAKKNAIKNKVDIKLVVQNILSIDTLDASYDIIISNPPYVRESEKAQMKNNVLNYEPDIALFVSDNDPLIFYKHIARLAIKSLKSSGALYFEINQYLGSALCTFLKDLGFKEIELKKDIYGVDRMIRAIKI